MIDERHHWWASPLAHFAWISGSATAVSDRWFALIGVIVGISGSVMTFLINIDAIVTGLIRLAFMAQKLWRLARHGRKPKDPT